MSDAGALSDHPGVKQMGRWHDGVAGGVRDLRKRDPHTEQSYSERQMYQAALERLAREFAAIEEIDQETAAVRLEDMMDAA